MARNRKKHAAEALQQPTPAADLAPNEQTAAVSFPLERTPLPPQVTYYCAAANCPGYEYPADQTQHPVATCGSLLSNMARPGRTDTEIPPSGVETHEMPPITTTDNEKPELAALENTGFAAENLSTVLERQLPADEQSPEPINTIALAALIADTAPTELVTCEECAKNSEDGGDKFEPSGGAQEQAPAENTIKDMPPLGEPSPEPPPPPDPPVDPAIPEESEPSPEPRDEARSLVPGFYAPRDKSKIGLVEVKGATDDGGVVVRSFYPDGYFDGVFDGANLSGLEPASEAELGVEWLDRVYTRANFDDQERKNRERIRGDLLNAFELSGIHGVLDYIREKKDLQVFSVRKKLEEMAEPKPSLEPSTTQLPSELNQSIDELRAELGVSGWQIIRVIDSVVRATTQIASTRETLKSSPVVSTLLERIRTSLDVGVLRSAAQDLVRRVVDELVEVRVSAVRSDLEAETQQKLAEIERLHADHLEELTKAHEDLDSLVKEAAGVDPDELERLEKRVKERLTVVLEDLEVLQKSCAHLQKRLDKAEAQAAKATAKPTRREALRASEIARPPQTFAPRRIIHKTPGQKAAKARRKDSRQLELPQSLLPKIHRGKGKTRGKGRPPAGYWDRIDAYMGKRKNADVRAILGKIRPEQLTGFIEQTKYGLPDLGKFGWNQQDIATFTAWFYGRKR